MNNYLDNISNNCNKYLILSWAIPNQPGHGHVNCLSNQEVIEMLEKRNFKYLAAETQKAREAVKNDRCYWFEDTLLIFEKKNI